MKKLYLTVFFLLTATCHVFAENIILKTGKEIEGKIVERTDEYIKIDTDGMTLTYFLSDIESISGDKVKPSGNKTSSQDTSDRAAGDNSILEKIKDANKRITRRSVKGTLEADVKGVSHLKTETAGDIDLANRVMYMRMEIKEYDLNLQDIYKSKLDKVIAEAEKKGIPAEKIQQVQQVMEMVNAQIAKMAGQLKGKKYEMFLVNDTRYLFLNNGWVKIGVPSSEEFWRFLASGQGASDADTQGLGQQISKVCPLYESTSLFGESDKIEQFAKDGFLISEGDYSGSPCYVLDMQTEGMRNFIEQKLLATVRQKKGGNVRPSIDSFNIKEFVSRDNYLILGITANAVASFSNPLDPLAPMKQFIRQAVAYEYPTSQIKLPAGLSQAVSVKDETELKKLFQEDMGIAGSAGQLGGMY